MTHTGIEIQQQNKKGAKKASGFPKHYDDKHLNLILPQKFAKQEILDDKSSMQLISTEAKVVGYLLQLQSFYISEISYNCKNMEKMREKHECQIT